MNFSLSVCLLLLSLPFISNSIDGNAYWCAYRIELN